jgi:amino acid transporter
MSAVWPAAARASTASATQKSGSWPGAGVISSSSRCASIMPTARAVLAMSAHGAIPGWFARMHPRFRTPTVATLAMGAVSALFYVMLAAVSKNVLADSASATGLLIAFYYGLTGFACVWFFRRNLFTSARTLLVKGILPLVGG